MGKTAERVDICVVASIVAFALLRPITQSSDRISAVVSRCLSYDTNDLLAGTSLLVGFMMLVAISLSSTNDESVSWRIAESKSEQEYPYLSREE